MRRLFAVPLILVALPALAGELPDGVYLTPPERCDEARQNGIESVLEQGELMLSRRGLEGYEYNCEFIQVAKASRSAGWLVTALCEEPGLAVPDIITIMPRGEGELELTSLSGGRDGGVNDGLYGKCDGVSPP